MSKRQELGVELDRIATAIARDGVWEILRLARMWRLARSSVAASAKALQEKQDDPARWESHVRTLAGKNRAEWRLACAVRMLEDRSDLPELKWERIPAPEDVTPSGPVGQERGAPEGGG